MKEKEMESDKFIDLMGHIGRWQTCLCVLIFLIKFPSAWYQLAIIFLAPNIKFQCSDTVVENVTYFDSKCVDNCSRYVYDTSIFVNTIISEWDLVCEDAWLKSLAQTVFMFGLLTGSPFFGFFSDRYGRRKGFLSALILLLVFGISNSFNKSYVVFAVFRFLVGFASAGTMITSFVVCMELVGAKYREVIGICYQVPFILGNVTLPLFAYYFRSWNTFTLALTLPSLFFLIYFWILPESPRWLITNQKIDEATEIINRALKRNNRDTTNLRERIKEISDDIHSARDSTSKANYCDLFRKNLRVNTVCSSLVWLVCGFFFFGVSQYVSVTSSNIFISVAVSGAIQIPAVFITILVTKVFGRKISMIASLTISGVAMLIIGFVNLTLAWHLTVSCIAMFGSSISFNTIYIYTTELYPTVVRNMGMGVAMMMSRIGSMVAPFAVSMSSIASWLPPTLFGISVFLAAIACLFLPETNGIRLQDTLPTDTEMEKSTRTPS